MQLNHINLTSADVLGDVEMFRDYFGLQVVAVRGRGLALLEDGNGMVLVLNDFKRLRAGFSYPENRELLHIGFTQQTRQEVDSIHLRLALDGWRTDEPFEYYGTWRFYFKARGGYFVEVSTPTPVSSTPSVTS